MKKKKEKYTIELYLTQNNDTDFDRYQVCKSLGLVPTENHGPKTSKGQIKSSNIEEAKKILRGYTIKTFDKPPYKMMKNACLKFSTAEESSESFENAMSEFEKLFYHQKEILVNNCLKNDLFVEVIIDISGKKRDFTVNLPEEFIRFLADINASVIINYN